MSGANVKIGMNSLESAIREALEETRTLTEDALIKATDKTAKETVKRIKNKAPKRSGEYQKGWTSKVTRAAGRGGYGRTVHNRKRYMLTHLLQNGHGGPVTAGAFPHIQSDEETAELFENNLESEMRKG